jgi:hypothetical protein
MEGPADDILPAAIVASSNSTIPSVVLALLLLVVTTLSGWGWSVLAKRRALARLRQRAGCAPLRILPSGRLHLLLIKSRKQPNLLTCLGVARSAGTSLLRTARGSPFRGHTGHARGTRTGWHRTHRATFAPQAPRRVHLSGRLD